MEGTDTALSDWTFIQKRQRIIRQKNHLEELVEEGNIKVGMILFLESILTSSGMNKLLGNNTINVLLGNSRRNTMAMECCAPIPKHTLAGRDMTKDQMSYLT